MATENGDQGDQTDFARQVIDALRGGSFVRNPTAAEDINNYAECVRTCLDELTAMLEGNHLEFLDSSTKAVEGLIKSLEKLMKRRTNARAASISGNVFRIGGMLALSHPLGQAAFWGGVAVSYCGDTMAANRTTEIEELSNNINGFFERDRERFSRLARAIQNLDDAIGRNTGWSLYDEDFQEFLRTAQENPDQVVVTIPQANADRGNAIQELARNRAVLELLQMVVNGVQRADVGVLNLISLGFHAVSYLQNTPEEAAVFQLAEVALRGLTLIVEYKNNQKTLEHFLKEVQRMKKEYQALYRIYGPTEG